MIEVSGLTKHYGPTAAVQDVSFTVDEGDIVGFLGPNAAGKTTTMRVLTGFLPATSGTARVAGHDVAKAPLEVKRRVGYLPENVPLYPEMLVHRFLQYVATVKGVPRAGRRREVERVMERCGLSDMASRVIRHLSKGYRQRVGLAQALVGDPPVLILDEPTVGLDPRQIIEIRRAIRDLAGNHTVLLSTHILPEVAMVCRRVVIIHQGRIVAQDSMDNLTGKGIARVLHVEVAGAEEPVLRLLRGVEGVSAVMRGGGPDEYRVHTTGAPEVRDAVTRAVATSGYGLRGLRAYTRTLEEVFVEATSAGKEEGA